MRRVQRDQWVPARVPGTVEYWEAPFIPLADAAAVTAWAGRMGKYTAVQGTPPVMRTNGLAGNAAVQFITDDFLAIDSMASLFNGSDVAWTFSFVLSLQNAGATESVFSLGNSADTNQFVQIRTTAANAVQIVVRGSGDGANITASALITLTNDAPSVITIAQGGTAFDSFLNGAKRGSAVALDYGTVSFDRCGLAVLRRTIDQQIGSLKMHAAHIALGKAPDADIERLHRFYMGRLGLSP